MRKVWTVARHEYWHHVRRRGFLVSTFVMPIALILGFIGVLVVLVLSERVERIGYVDDAKLFATLPEQATWNGISPMGVVRYATLEQAREALNSESIEAVFVIPADYIERGEIQAYTKEGIPTLLEQEFSRFLAAGITQRLAGEPNPRVLDPITTLQTNVLDAPPGSGRNAALTTLIPLIFSFILLGSTFAGGSYLMAAIAEEKENRIIEILASSLSPYQMMAGKIIGLGGLALTQLTVWTSGGVCIFVWIASQSGLIGEQGLAASVLWIGLILFVPTYFIIAGTLAAIGAAVSSLQEGQQLTGIVTLVSTLPIWFVPIISRNPNGWVAIVFNTIPHTAPITLMTRIVSTAVPPWQIIGTIAWLWLAAIGIMLISGKIVEYGLRHFERRLTWRDLRTIFGRG